MDRLLLLDWIGLVGFVTAYVSFASITTNNHNARGESNPNNNKQNTGLISCTSLLDFFCFNVTILIGSIITITTTTNTRLTESGGTQNVG
jgi:hypothetical protein